MTKEKMSIRNQFIFANIGLSAGVLVFSFVYPWQAVLITAVICYPLANLILYFKAKKMKKLVDR